MSLLPFRLGVGALVGVQAAIVIAHTSPITVGGLVFVVCSFLVLLVERERQ